MIVKIIVECRRDNLQPGLSRKLIVKYNKVGAKTDNCHLHVPNMVKRKQTITLHTCSFEHSLNISWVSSHALITIHSIIINNSRRLCCREIYQRYIGTNCCLSTDSSSTLIPHRKIVIRLLYARDNAFSKIFIQTTVNNHINRRI